MSKKLYPNDDINDLVKSEEESFFKGGEGSGIKGHKTAKQDKPKIPKYPDAIVFDSEDGMIKVGQRDGGYYADVGGEYDMSANTLEEMETKLKKLGAKYAGYDEF